MENYEFKILIQNIHLNPDFVERLNAALKQAVLTELAQIPLGSKKLEISPLMVEMGALGGPVTGLEITVEE